MRAGKLKYPALLLTPGAIDGLALSHAADTDHDITIAAGYAKDATYVEDMVLTSATTKRFDAEWVVGSTNGGFAAGESLPASGTIHIWLIKRPDTGVVDVMGNNHATSGLTPTLPTNYNYKRRIASLRTNSSSNIIGGDQWGTGRIRTWMYDAPILDLSTADAEHTTGVTLALSVPTGIAVVALVGGIGGNRWRGSALNNTDQTLSLTGTPLAFTEQGAYVPVITNTSSQIRYRGMYDLNALYLVTAGFHDSL